MIDNNPESISKKDKASLRSMLKRPSISVASVRPTATAVGLSNDNKLAPSVLVKKPNNNPSIATASLQARLEQARKDCNELKGKSTEDIMKMFYSIFSDYFNPDGNRKRLP